MIFATVGTTQFDELVEAMDKIAPKLNEEVVIQIGNRKYIPKNCKYFTFDEDLLKYFKNANIIISHGGAGITFEVLNLGKKLISIENPHVLGGHQGDLLGRLSQAGYLIWCKDLNKIENCIKDAKKMKIKKYVRPECEIGRTIVGWLG
jgi:beta-1,4-N-acetylglucosaminyltransferase